jgi:GAF domain-containing protein
MTKAESYRWAAKRVRAQVERHQDLVATLANTAAILKEYRPNFFWVGFYFFRQDHLLLGPFQGPPACVRLEMSKGVCAHAASTRQTVVVANVHEFPGHVACDSRSNSEIVVPLFDSFGSLQAVLDVDSEQLGDFDDQDRQGLQEIAKWLEPVWNLTIK